MSGSPSSAGCDDHEVFLGAEGQRKLRFKPGARVQCHGLGGEEARTLNGKLGKVIRYSSANEKFVVSIEQEQKMIAPSNLRKAWKTSLAHSAIGSMQKAGGMLSPKRQKKNKEFQKETEGNDGLNKAADYGVPEAAWSRSLAEPPPPASVHQPARPPILSTETASLLPLAARLGTYVVKERAQYRDPFFDLSGIDLHPPDPGPYAGVPLGGIGCGSINRGYRGDFRRWSLLPGRYFHNVHHGCQFSVRMKTNDKSPSACVLVDGADARVAASKSSKLSGLRTWNWGMNPACASYYALFPRAWTIYENPLPEYPGIVLVCKQISPVMGSSSEAIGSSIAKGEYVESSLPCAVFEWSIENKSDEDVEVSLMFSWEGAAGVPTNRHHTAKYHAPFQRCNGQALGVEMKGSIHSRKVYDVSDKGNITFRETMARMASKAPQMQFEDDFSYAIACGSQDSANCGVTCCPCFTTSSQRVAGEVSASDLWSSFVDYGALPCEMQGDCNESKYQSEATAGPINARDRNSALCRKIIVPAGCKRDVRFALSWDIPIIRFGSGKTLARRYTRFFGKEGNAAPSLAAWALHRLQAWEKRIVAWQAPVLNALDLPNFYKHLLFNELYYIADGGGLWTEADDDHVASSEVADGKNCLQHYGLSIACETTQTDAYEESISAANAVACQCSGDASKVGHFLYLEGHEYLMYNTYDVHFYASWALVMNWPQLQLSLQRDLITAIAAEDLTERTSIAEKQRHRRKVSGVVPHDVGSPSEEPWIKVNSYNLQDVSRWKDLGPKFVLQVYRDYCATRDLNYLKDAWSTMLSVISSMEKYDRDKDGLIENDGYPDQTYDVWTVRGASAYTGGLWVASLSAMFATAKALLALPVSSDIVLQPDFLQERAEYYEDLWRRARHSYVSKLWCDQKGYFNYDCSGSTVSDSCMSDQCAGQGWARACGLPSVCDEDDSGAKASSALLSVLDLNVYRFGELCASIHGAPDVVVDSEGTTRHCFLAGAVNGMRPARKKRSSVIDNSCLQSREVWTGTSYGLAGAMLQESMVVSSALSKELRRGAFDILKGIHRGGWTAFGYWFATPEAWEATGNVRCMGYMRPLSIWSAQWALAGEMQESARGDKEEKAVALAEEIQESARADKEERPLALAQEIQESARGDKEERALEYDQKQENLQDSDDKQEKASVQEDAIGVGSILVLSIADRVPGRMERQDLSHSLDKFNHEAEEKHWLELPDDDPLSLNSCCSTWPALRTQPSNSRRP